MRSWLPVSIHCLCMLALFQALRLLFWQQNQLQFAAPDQLPWLGILGQGLRFDLSTLALSLGPVYFLFLLPWPAAWSRWQRSLTLLLTSVLSSAALALNLVDVEYFKFTGKRLTRDSLAIAQDIEQQATSIFSYYWQYSLLLVLLIGLCIWISSRCFGRYQPQSDKAAIPIKLASALLSLPLIVLAARGGWQVKPLIPAHALSLGRSGILALNSSFTLLKSSGKATLEEKNFLPPSALEPLLFPAPSPLSSEALASPRPQNIVLVILESFGKEYVESNAQRPSYAPFLESLMQQGSSFPLAFANGRRSIDALPALLASIPAWMEPSFITSPYQTNRVQGLPEVLARHGWTSSFYHGGKNGTMFFDVMARQFGFNRYLGASEYPHPSDSDGQWGIFDEPFLQWVLSDLDQHAQPFFAAVFTLSSHHPYKIPPAYAGRFPKGTLEIHESIGYADYALRRFYEEARKKPWFAKTLFIFTADHTSKSESPLYETPAGHFAVPLLFIQNDQPVPLAGLDQPAQHSDLAPTVMDMLGIEPPGRSPFGASLWRRPTRPGVVLYEGSTYHLLSSDKILIWAPPAEPLRFSWREDPLLQRQEALPPDFSSSPEMLFLKAQIQAFNNGMVGDRLLW